LSDEDRLLPRKSSTPFLFPLLFFFLNREIFSNHFLNACCVRCCVVLRVLRVLRALCDVLRVVLRALRVHPLSKLLQQG
jgi:hypothetical protein